MDNPYIEDKRFEGIDYSSSGLPRADYDRCEFINCNFSGADLSDINFSETRFENCDFSLVKLVRTSLKSINFKSCKLLGIHFETCNEFLFEVGFEKCNLKLSSFYKMKLKGTIFEDSNLEEVDFAESNLKAASFQNCILSDAIFDQTDLENADFRTATNYSIDPHSNHLKKTRFSKGGLEGLLHKFNILIDD